MPADISEQTESIRAKGTIGLNCNWDKMMGFGQQSILLPHSGFSSCGYSSSSPCGIMQRCMMLRRCQHKKRHWPDFHGAMEQPLGQVTCHLICIGQWAQVLMAIYCSLVTMYNGINSSMPRKMTLLLIQLFCKSGHTYNLSGCTFHYITVKTCISIV